LKKILEAANIDIPDNYLEEYMQLLNRTRSSEIADPIPALSDNNAKTVETDKN
jgi:hypothetical protein